MKKALAWLVLAIVVLAVGVSVAWRILTREEPLDLDPPTVRLEVVNGCGIPRLGRAVADKLEARGFVVYGTRNSDQAHERTRVVDLLDPRGECAEKVSAALSRRQRRLGLPVGPRLAPEASVGLDSTRFLEVLVVVGQDFRRFFPDLVVLR